MLRLKLPEEVVGEKAVLEEEGEAREVKAVPLQGPLDPILEAAVESQPRVAGPKEASQEEPARPEPEPEETPRGAPTTKSPFGFLAALGAGALVLLGVALAGKGGASANGSGGTPGANPTPTAPGGGIGSGPVIW